MRFFLLIASFSFIMIAAAQQQTGLQTDSVQPGQVVINEFLAINTSVVDDFYGEFDDWVELYNNTANTISLDNVYLSDSYNNRLKWQFPIGTTIGPNAYVIVWTDGDSLQVNGFHAPFKLSGSGEKVMLSYANGFVIDSVRYGQQVEDISWGRYPNGTGPYMALIPTFAAPNSPLGFAGSDWSGFRLYPNPVKNNITIEVPSPEKFDKIEIVNELGQVLFAGYPEHKTMIDLAGIAPGVLFVKLHLTDACIVRRILKL